MAKGLEKIEKGAMKTVMGIPKTAKHPTKTVKHPTKKGEKAMSGTSLGWFAGEKRIWDRPGGLLWKDSRTSMTTWLYLTL